MTFNQSPWMDEELTLFRDNVRKFIATEITPFEEHWDSQQHVERTLWTRAGARLVWRIETIVQERVAHFICSKMGL